MNKIIEQSEADLKKSISKMSQEDLSSLLRLINREISLTQQELKRTYNLLEIAKEKQNKLEVFRYEQNLRDIDLEIEKLDRKKEICQSNSQNFNGCDRTSVKMPSNIINAASIVQSSPFRISPNPPENNDQTICLSTKRLINDFEKRNSVTVPTPSISNQNIKKSNFKDYQNFSTTSLPRNSILKVEMEPNKSQEPFFSQIKLKKVGLPQDAQEVDQNSLPDVLSSRKDSVKMRCQSQIIEHVSIKLRSPSVDLTKSTEVSSKDKFLNVNKEIQAAIQNEIKEMRLKKTNVNSPQPNYTGEHLNMGKFNFSNERILSTNNSVSNSMSTSKSMPFLNSIASLSMVFDDQSSVPSSQLIPIEENLEVSDFESYLRNWDPAVVLKQLYMIQRKSNELPSNKMSMTKYSAYIDFLLGVNPGGTWQRKYITITNGQIYFYKNQTSVVATDILDLRTFELKLALNNIINIYDSRGIHSSFRCLKSSDCQQLLASAKQEASQTSIEIIPHIYETIKENNSRKVLIIDLGSCSVRAGLLKVEATLPGLYFPHIAAISKETKDVVEVGLEVFNSKIMETCYIIRPLKPDTTLEHLAFTSGTVQRTITKICSYFQINPTEYIAMLSLPYNVAESTRSKLADVMLQRLNFKGVSMCGESLLALQAYGKPTGLLVDIGYRTEILPVTHGVVQTASVRRGLFGGHLMQVALTHLLPFELHSITDSLLSRLIMEKLCCTAKNGEEALIYNKSATLDLQEYNLPPFVQSSLVLQGKDRCLPIEGLFNPEIYSIDTLGLPAIIKQSIQSCPMDFRKDLYQSIYLSGAATQVNGLIERLEFELKKDLPSNCEVKIYAAPDRAHFSYVGACFVASSEGFMNTVVNQSEWDDSRISALRKWNF